MVLFTSPCSSAQLKPISSTDAPPTLDASLFRTDKLGDDQWSQGICREENANDIYNASVNELIEKALAVVSDGNHLMNGEAQTILDTDSRMPITEAANTAAEVETESQHPTKEVILPFSTAFNIVPLSGDSDLSTDDNTTFHDAVMFETTPSHESATRTSTTSPEKRVAFSDMVLCYDVLGLDFYTPEERKAYWFDGNDMACIKQNAKSETMLLDRGLLREGRWTTSRGLPTRGGQKKRRRKRLEAYAAVFSEIDFQEEEGFQDDRLIADAYATFSDDCALTAREAAIEDAIAAAKIYAASMQDQKR